MKKLIKDCIKELKLKLTEIINNKVYFKIIIYQTLNILR